MIELNDNQIDEIRDFIRNNRIKDKKAIHAHMLFLLLDMPYFVIHNEESAKHFLKEFAQKEGFKVIYSHQNEPNHHHPNTHNHHHPNKHNHHHPKKTNPRITIAVVIAIILSVLAPTELRGRIFEFNSFNNIFDSLIFVPLLLRIGGVLLTRLIAGYYFFKNPANNSGVILIPLFSVFVFYMINTGVEKRISENDGLQNSELLINKNAVVISRTSAHVRDSDSKQGNIVANLHRGDSIYVLSKMPDTKWYKVSYGKEKTKIGFIAPFLVKIDSLTIQE